MLTVSVSSPPTHHELVADIMWESGNRNEQAAEIRRDDGAFVATIFAKSTGQPWEFALTELREALDRAATQLTHHLGD